MPMMRRQRTSMTAFKDIQKILDDAVGGDNIGAHGPFWRNITRDQFVAKNVFSCPILFRDATGKLVGKDSLLIQILRGPVKDCKGKNRPQMPFGFDPVPADQIATIEKWIDDQAPE